MPLTSSALIQAAWDKLAALLQTAFYKPDLEALRIVLAACRAHYHAGDPVWLFVIGPPGSGKTSVVINSISALPNVSVESSITEKTFLSGASVGDETSLLLHVGSGILAFKDFTTILSKNDETQREIIGQLREIYDGAYTSKTGVKWRTWNGKITVIAAVTPAIERAWAVTRELGERFLQVRWESGGGREAAEFARLQRGKEKEIADGMRRGVKAFFSSSSPAPVIQPYQGHFLDTLAIVVAQLRGHIVRDKTGSRDIIDIPPFESPTRLAKSFESVAVHHAALFNRECGSEDLGAALRLGLDSIPSRRAAIIKSIPLDSPITADKIAELSGVPRRTLDWHLNELEALQVVTLVENPILGKNVTFTAAFLELWNDLSSST